MSDVITFKPIHMRFHIGLQYPRSRKFRLSCMGHRSPPLHKKWWNHPFVNPRPKPYNRSRDTFIHYNARARKNNLGE